MSQTTKTNSVRWVVSVMHQLTARRKKLTTSWMKARGMLRNPRQIRALERHVKKVRAEWK